MIAAINLAALWAFVPLMLWAAVSDLLRFEIPNRISLLLCAAFFVAVVTADTSPIPILWHVAAAAAVFLAGFGLFAIRIFGGGDVKLLAVAALWCGWALLPMLLVIIALSGGVLALILVVGRRIYPKGWGPIWLARLFDRQSAVPYGVAIAAGNIWLFIAALRHMEIFLAP